MKATVIVTGAAGFIGSHLCEALVGQNFHVIAIDDLSTGKKAHLNQVMNKIDFIEGCLLDSKTLTKACNLQSKPDAIFHLAAIPSVTRSIEVPEESHKVNIHGTFEVLMAAHRHGIRRVIYSASSSAYGQQNEEPNREELCPDLISPYGLQKWVGEKYCELFDKFFNLETIALRYFNVFGPRQDPNSVYSAVIPKFIKAVLDDLPVTIHGDGLQSRDFTYVENVVVGNLRAFLAPKEACGKVYNIATGESITLLSLLDNIELLIGKKAKREFQPSRVGDIRHSKASIQRAEKILNYSPCLSLDEGLRLTIESMKVN